MGEGQKRAVRRREEVQEVLVQVQKVEQLEGMAEIFQEHPAELGEPENGDV